MTYTLHRRGDQTSLAEDYILMIIPARGFNHEGSEEKLRKAFEIISHYKVVNYGNASNGNIHRTTLDKLMKVNNRLAHAVFQDRENLLGCLRELKEKDLGLSVVVSGLYETTVQCCQSLGLKPHTVEHSLETHGAMTKLPPSDVLEIVTMCGHALVSPSLVESLVKEVKGKKKTLEEAADELSRLCDCGIFNPPRATKLLRKIIERR